MSHMPNAPRFLVIRRRYMGDIVLLGNVFANIKHRHPNAHLAVLVEAKFADVPRMWPAVDQVVPLPSSAAGWPNFLRILRRSRFTHVLDYDNRFKTGLLGLLTGAQIRATLRQGDQPRSARFYTDRLVVESDFFERGHIVDFYNRLLNLVNVPVATGQIQLQPPAEARAAVDALTELQNIAKNTPKVFIHPGSRSPHRIWPADRFAEIITRLQTQNISPILVAGKAEQDVLHQIQSHLDIPAPAISRPLTIPQLAALFASANVLLCHDSGPMHLAAAVGTRVVALFSSQSITTWRPLGDKHITLQAPMPCNPCLSPNFCVPSDSYHNHCVRHLSVEQVFNAVLQQLGRVS